MKLNSMDAVRVNIDSARVKVMQGAEVGLDGASYANGAEKTAGSRHKAYTTLSDSKQQNGIKPLPDEPDYNKLIKDAVEKVNKVISSENRKFVITVHEKTKDILVKVIDTETNETIKEIPPKKIVDIVVNLCELAGIIFDAKG